MSRSDATGITAEGRSNVVTESAGSDNAANDDVPSFLDRYEGTVGVSTNDPGHAFARGVARFEIRFPEATVVSECRTELDSDRDAYMLRIELLVGEDGQDRSTRRWERRIPRDQQ